MRSGVSHWARVVLNVIHAGYIYPLVRVLAAICALGLPVSGCVGGGCLIPSTVRISLGALGVAKREKVLRE
jgi:hypothetical protein